jgi:hypothetical protein
MIRTLHKAVVIGLSAVSLTISVAGTAQSGPFVLNGDFSVAATNVALTPAIVSATFTPASWTYAGGDAFVYAFGTADTIGGNAGLPVFLWGPGNPSSGPYAGPNSANGLTASSCPTCGNYLASDSDPGFSGAFSQTITGLTPGQTYALDFDFGAAQFRDYNGGNWNGKTNSRWDVTFAGILQQTPDLNIADHGFSGWLHEQFTYTIPLSSSGSEILRFLAVGGPNPLPPVALLDNVSLSAVPEPPSLWLMSVGLLGFLAAWRRQRRRI